MNVTPTMRRWVQLAAFLGVLVLIAAAVQWAWLSAPETPLEVVPAGAEDPESVEARTLTCERTLPDTPTTDIERVEPVGRVSSAAVNACPDVFDGLVVDYIGEVVGDVLARPDGAWVLVNDDDYALETGPLSGHTQFRGANSGLAVWLPVGQADLVDEPGDATRRGDVIRVSAIVNRTDPLDGGGLTLRALDTEVLVEAQYLETPVNRVQAGLAVLFTLVAAAVVVWDRRTSGQA